MFSNNNTSTHTRLELTHGLPAAEVGKRLRNASDDHGRNKRRLSFYLFDMHERRLYVTSGHANTAHFAETQLDMDARRTRELIQAGRTLNGLKLIDDAFRDGEISWSRVVMLLKVVQRETQQGWLDYAKTATCRNLRAEVKGCRPGDLPGEGSDYGLIYKKVNFEARLGESDLAWVEWARMQLSKSPELLLDDTALLVAACRAAVGGEHPPRPDHPVDDQDEERNDEEVPDEIREEVLRRDKHRCRNCHDHLDVHVHHIRPRSAGGTNDSHNLVVICSTCHASFHRDLLRIFGDPNHELWFTSTNGDPIHRGGHPPRHATEHIANTVGPIHRE